MEKKKRKKNGNEWILTSFLHVTWTRYFVSGQRDNSTLAESVNKLPIKPPPKTSHVTRQLISLFVGSHAKCVATRNSCLIIDAIRNCHWFWSIACWCDDIVLHVSQHCAIQFRMKCGKKRGRQKKKTIN